MPTINHKINMRTLAALKRVYDAQFELYEYALHHSIPIDYTQDVFMRRTLSDLADASEKILAHINLNDYDDAMDSLRLATESACNFTVEAHKVNFDQDSDYDALSGLCAYVNIISRDLQEIYLYLDQAIDKLKYDKIL